MKKRKVASKISKELSLRCSAKDCLMYASAFGGCPLELNLQWCNTHRKMLDSGQAVRTKRNLLVHKNMLTHRLEVGK